MMTTRNASRMERYKLALDRLAACRKLNPYLANECTYRMTVVRLKMTALVLGGES